MVSGGFDPLHSGHISYLKEASLLGDELWVCLNSDEWLKEKKGKPFMPFNERESVLKALSCVHRVIGFDDRDGSCKKGLKTIADMNPGAELIFCNGGDRDHKNIPEISVKGVRFEFNVGGSKKLNSSSEILSNWFCKQELRSWGFYNVIKQEKFLKVKELAIYPKCGMSFQRHFHREEFWFIVEGSCLVFFKDTDNVNRSITLKEGEDFHVPIKMWHQITNPYDINCRIIEVQSGKLVKEDDIERAFYFPKTPL